MAKRSQVSLDPAFSLAIPGVVAEVERSTSAEVVVVVHRPTTQLRPQAVVSGLAAALSALAMCLWAHFTVSEAGVLFIVTVAAVVGGAVGQVLGDRLHSVEDRHARALRRARAAFVRYGVHRTRARTGLVVLLDEAEGRMALVADTAVEGAVPQGRIDSVAFGDGPDGRDLSGLQPVLDGLRALGVLLAQGLPADPHDNPEELDNAPRVLP